MYFLENDKVGLRPLELGDIEGNYSHWLNDEEVCKYNTHHRFPSRKSDLEAYVKSLENDKSAIVCAIIEKIGKVHIGNISLQYINLIDRKAEIAFLLGEKGYQNKGYAKAAAMLLIEHGFTQLGLERIELGTSTENIPMQRLAESLGFQKEGVRRAALFKHGCFVDIIEYGLLKKEWRAE
jgi:RimJ/RimL family protein N-acetyltransferase